MGRVCGYSNPLLRWANTYQLKAPNHTTQPLVSVGDFEAVPSQVKESCFTYLFIGFRRWKVRQTWKLMHWNMQKMAQDYRYIGLYSTAFAKRAFRFSAAATWNSLPTTVTDNDSLGTFKSRLKTFLFSLAFNWHMTLSAASASEVTT